MSFSTQVGDNAPLSSSGVTIVRSLARAPAPPHLHSAAPPVSVTTVGVGHIPLRPITASEEHVLRPIRAFIAMCPSKDFPSSFATGVGNDPDPFAAVGRTHVGR
jgi:hypothetical protein